MTRTLPIALAPGYFVSDDGSVSSERMGDRREMRPFANRHGHQRVTLRVGGRTVKEYVHRLVAVTFIGPPPSPRHEVRHLDGDPTNNAADNIAWGTHAENMRDMVLHGRHFSKTKPHRVARGARHGSRTKPERVARGERSGAATVTESDVRMVRLVFANTDNISEAARRAGVSRGAAKCIIQGLTWRHVA